MIILEGAISVKAAIANKKRDVYSLSIAKDKKTKDFNYIRKLASSNNIKINEIKKEDFASFPIGKTAGGIIAEVSPRRSDELVDGDIFLIDGIEDPFNIGYIMRTIYALGVNNLILPSRDYEKMEAQIMKSSAGAFDMLNILYTDDYVKTLKSLKDRYTIYALKRSEESKDIFEVEFKEPSIYLLGGEKRGLSKDLEELSDEYLYISYGNDFRNALNGASAATVLATLRYRQKR